MSWHGDDGVNGQWVDDEALARDLTAALAEDDLYRGIEQAGLRAFGFQRQLVALRDELDLLLLELVHDSENNDALVAVRDRSGTDTRSLVFEGLGIGVEVELTDDHVEGQLIPAGPGRVMLHGPDGVLAEVDTDEVGYFRVDVRPHGPVQLVCSSDTGACATQWLVW